MALRVLVACSDPEVREDLELQLSGAGYEAFCAADLGRARELARRSLPDVVLWGLEDGEAGSASRVPPWHPAGCYGVAIGSGDAPARSVLDGRRGFSDVLPLPCSSEELRLVIQRAAAWLRSQRELHLLRRDLARSAADRPIVAASPPMIELLEAMERAAGFRACVLIRGERGTGKEGLARAIHAQSERRAAPFVAIACAGSDEPSAAAALFGGAGDGAPGSSGGFLNADGGTLFLDDVDALSLACQERLLCVLQSEQVVQADGDKPRHVDVRVIAATTRDLRAAVAVGEFREDLLGRLASLELPVPPLRERPEDVPLLADHFTARACRALGLPRSTVGDDALERLVDYVWPGNVRELENLMERAALMARGGRITTRELPEDLEPGDRVRGGGLALRPARRRVEVELIRRALRQTGGNRTHAARLLEISHRALLYKLKEYGVGD